MPSNGSLSKGRCTLRANQIFLAGVFLLRFSLPGAALSIKLHLFVLVVSSVLSRQPHSFPWNPNTTSVYPSLGTEWRLTSHQLCACVWVRGCSIFCLKSISTVHYWPTVTCACVWLQTVFSLWAEVSPVKSVSRHQPVLRKLICALNAWWLASPLAGDA